MSFNPKSPDFHFKHGSNQNSVEHTGSFQQQEEEEKRYTFNPNDYQEFRRMVLQKQE
jgi:hypothetical protein